MEFHRTNICWVVRIKLWFSIYYNFAKTIFLWKVLMFLGILWTSRRDIRNYFITHNRRVSRPMCYAASLWHSWRVYLPVIFFANASGLLVKALYIIDDWYVIDDISEKKQKKSIEISWISFQRDSSFFVFQNWHHTKRLKKQFGK